MSRDVIDTEIRESEVYLPVQIIVERVVDDSGDDSWLGRFTLDKPYDGAIRVEIPWSIRRNLFQRDASGEYPRYAYYENPDGFGTLEQNRWTPYGRHDSWVRARDVLKQGAARLLAYYNDEWHFIGLCVRARWGSLEGTASLFGIEHGTYTANERAHQEEVIAELTDEALDALRDKLTKLATVIGAVG